MTGYELRFQMGLDVVPVDEPFEMPAGAWGEGIRPGRGEGLGGVVPSRALRPCDPSPSPAGLAPHMTLRRRR